MGTNIDIQMAANLQCLYEPFEKETQKWLPTNQSEGGGTRLTMGLRLGTMSKRMQKRTHGTGALLLSTDKKYTPQKFMRLQTQRYRLYVLKLRRR